MQPLNILVIGSYDSFLKSGLQLARRFAGGGGRVDTCIPFARKGQLSAAQLRDLALAPDIEPLPMEQLLTRGKLAGYELVIVSLAGEPSSAFFARFAELWRDAARRPLTLSLYPGIVFRFHYEGMLRRMGADLVLLNSPNDLEMYRELCAAARLSHCNGLLGGLAVLPGEQRRDRTPPLRECFLFVDQPTVPAPRAERMFLLQQIADFARRQPHVDVLVKPRHRPREMTLHRTRHHVSDLLDELVDLPSNLSLSYEPLDALWERVSFCASVSSTAVLEAVWRGIPARVITDLGVHENLGNHFFLGSGLLESFPRLRLDAPSVIDEAWARRHLCGMDARFDEIAGTVDELLAAQRSHGRALDPPARGDFAEVPSGENSDQPRVRRLFGWARRAVRGNR